MFTFGINLSEWINQFMERVQERKEERKLDREEARKQAMKEERETSAERRKREREERKAQKELEKQEKAPMENQIKINFGGRIVDNAEEKAGLKKYDHTGEDLEPLTKQSKLVKQAKQEVQPDVLENNLFKDVEEQKEEKKRAVLQLEHAMTVEDEH